MKFLKKIMRLQKKQATSYYFTYIPSRARKDMYLVIFKDEFKDVYRGYFTEFELLLLKDFIKLSSE